MVLFKRKPVQILPVPPDLEDDQEVWVIQETGEVFPLYEDYLARMDFYKQRRFICTISGHSGLTFFEALKSESEGAAEVDQAFPEALKGPVLRRVQFQTISRIDSLVDMIYEEFKNEYYPSEAVTVEVAGGDRLHGTVRDKTRFGARSLPDGTLVPSFSRYFVSLTNRPDEEAVVDDRHISRDRRIFTKSVLRSFIKKTVTREAWNGAPWLVKPDVAEYYHIDTRVPPHLRYDNKLLERKQLQAQKRLSQGDMVNGHAGPFSGSGQVRLPELKPAPRSHKSKAHQAAQLAQMPPGPGVVIKGKHHTFVGPQPGQFMHLPSPGNPFQLNLSGRHSIPPPPLFTQPEPAAPAVPPPPKYPIEDLQLEPRAVPRPLLQYACSDPPVPVEQGSPFGKNILMKSVGPLLETWDTLNVYCEILSLDSFTFDDYVEALQIASDETPVQLFDEVHCSVLKILVNAEAEDGKVQVQLPELDDGEEEEEGEDAGALPSPEPEPQPKGRATRSSLAKLEAERIAAEAAAAEKEMQGAAEAPKHRAEELLKDFDWIDQLRKREFKDGGWVRIMAGLLHQLSKKDRLKAKCEELLQHLVPDDVAPTAETARRHYMGMDINLRVQALQIMCILTAETKALRGYMENCSEEMTGLRKEKIELQRKRKQAMEELKPLNDQRKILLPDNMIPSPPMEATKVNGDVKMSDVEDAHLDGSDEVPDTDDDVPGGGRKLRHAKGRAAERKRKVEEEKDRKDKAEAAAKAPRQSKAFLKVLKDIQKKEEEIKQCEDQIAVLDNDLREADCPRTRVLGKDRFWNRYYWFERNGMPYGGLPDSSTASAGYANGCIWVQGPDEMERVGYIDATTEYQEEYRAKFHMTVPERKKLEEGKTSVFNAHQWGFFASPKDVDALLDWLDPRGHNELKLRKEIVNFRDKIVTNMENRKKYLEAAGGAETAAGENGQNQDQEEEEEEEEVKKSGAKGSKRMSTRGRTAPATPEPPTHRCLAWVNTTALREVGHLHSEPPPLPASRARKQTARKKETLTVVASPEPVAVTTRSKKKK